MAEIEVREHDEEGEGMLRSVHRRSVGDAADDGGFSEDHGYGSLRRDPRHGPLTDLSFHLLLMVFPSSGFLFFFGLFIRSGRTRQ